MRNSIIKQALGFMLPLMVTATAMFFAASCGSGNETEEDPSLTVTPSVREISFSADGLKAFDGGPSLDALTEITPMFTVETDQPSWNVELTPADSWLSVTKNSTDFTLTAEVNDTAQERGPVTVTVTAGTAEAVVITVRQQENEVEQPLSGVALSVTLSNDVNDYAYYWHNGELTLLGQNANASKITSY